MLSVYYDLQEVVLLLFFHIPFFFGPAGAIGMLITAAKMPRTPGTSAPSSAAGAGSHEPPKEWAAAHAPSMSTAAATTEPAISKRVPRTHKRL